jgi:hypothetical protein
MFITYGIFALCEKYSNSASWQRKVELSNLKKVLFLKTILSKPGVIGVTNNSPDDFKSHKGRPLSLVRYPDRNLRREILSKKPY